MKKISELLLKFKNLEHPDAKKEILLKQIVESTGLLLNKKQLELHGGILFIKADSYVKNEIFLQQEKILQELKEKLPNFKIKKIL